MSKTRERLDYDHPCLTCGAPWRITEVAISAAESLELVDWRPMASDCSRGVGAHDLAAYNAGLAERHERGW